jgi:hypothetical protein
MSDSIHVMKKHIALIGCLVVFGFLAGCDQKSAPLKEGVIWKVVWSETPTSQSGLFRVKTLPTNSQPAGEYGVEMAGKLYPTFLEIQRTGSSHSQIIPMSQILQLEFGE